MLYDDYDLTPAEDEGVKQEPLLSREEQTFWYWEEKNFKYYQKLMMPSWISHSQINDMKL